MKRSFTIAMMLAVSLWGSTTLTAQNQQEMRGKTIPSSTTNATPVTGTIVNAYDNGKVGSSGVSMKAACIDTLLFEDFQSQSIPSTWLNIDNDMLPDNNNRPMDWHIVENLQTTTPGDTDYVAASSSWFSSPGQSDNWLITDALQPCAQTVIEWDASPFEGPSYADGYQILVSTTGTNFADFTDTIFVAAEDGSTNGTGVWSAGYQHQTWNGSNGVMESFQQSLGVYDNQTIYIAFAHRSFDDNFIRLDNIFVGLPYCGPTVAFADTANELSVAFTDQSAVNGALASYVWDFGDGDTLVAQNPTHTYSAPGTYLVCLTVVDSCNTQTFCDSITVTCATPDAGFTYSGGELSATFTDTSTGAGIAGWSWDFGDGNTSTAQNPTHNYAAPGTYNVCLITTSPCGAGADTACQSITVTCTDPTAQFNSNVNSLSVQFTDNTITGTSVLSWAWDFGDGNTSTMQDPMHTYAASGTYNVCLVIQDSCGSDSSCENIFIVGVGVDELLVDQTSIYPNPVQDQLTIDGLQVGEQYEVLVLNQVGQVVANTASNGQSNVIIHTTALAEGFYTVQIRANGQIANHRLVKVD